VILRLAAACLLALSVAHGEQQRIAPPSTAPMKTLSAEEADALRPAFEKLSFATADGQSLPYRLLRPERPEADKVYPLVIMLHGSGQIGTDNESQLDNLALSWAQPEMRSRYPAYVAVPQFPARTANYQVSTMDKLLASHPGAALLPLFELVDQLTATLPVDAARIYLVGFSMGASAAWHAMLLHQGKFAAAVLLSGVPPERTLAPLLQSVPLLICHGDADPQNPYAPDLAMYRALGPASKAVFRTYTGMGHTVPPDIADPSSTWWRDWLFAQHR
jgi:predicted peptidase